MWVKLRSYYGELRLNVNDEKVSLILKFRNMRTEDFVEDYMGIKLTWWKKLYIRMMTKILEKTIAIWANIWKVNLMGKKRKTDRQQVKEWMNADNIEANELMVSKIFERAKYFENIKMSICKKHI